MDVSYPVSRLTTAVVRVLKPSHVRALVTATHMPDVSMSELFRCIVPKLHEQHWVALTVVHVLAKDGNTDRVLGYLAANTDKLSVAGFRDRSGHPMGSIQTKNIKTYAAYLEERALCYKDAGKDWISAKDAAIAKFRSFPVHDGLLKEVTILQRLAASLLGCSWFVEDLDQVVTLQAFRLLLWDMMSIFHILNEAVVRILSIYFELDRVDAAKALDIYKTFAMQAKKMLEFFETGRRVRREIAVDIPQFTHPPLSLAKSLEDYLRAPDFEAQRAAYRSRKNQKSSEPKAQPTSTSNEPKRSQTVATKQKDTQLIDFFDSVDQGITSYNTTQVQNQFATPSFDTFWDQNDAFSARAAAADPFSPPSLQLSMDNPFANTQAVHSQLQQQQQQADLLLKAAASQQQQLNTPAPQMFTPSVVRLYDASATFNAQQPSAPTPFGNVQTGPTSSAISNIGITPSSLPTASSSHNPFLSNAGNSPALSQQTGSPFPAKSGAFSQFQLHQTNPQPFALPQQQQPASQTLNPAVNLSSLNPFALTMNQTLSQQGTTSVSSAMPSQFPQMTPNQTGTSQTSSTQQFNSTLQPFAAQQHFGGSTSSAFSGSSSMSTHGAIPAAQSNYSSNPFSNLADLSTFSMQSNKHSGTTNAAFGSSAIIQQQSSGTTMMVPSVMNAMSGQPAWSSSLNSTSATNAGTLSTLQPLAFSQTIPHSTNYTVGTASATGLGLHSMNASGMSNSSMAGGMISGLGGNMLHTSFQPNQFSGLQQQQADRPQQQQQQQQQQPQQQQQATYNPFLQMN